MAVSGAKEENRETVCPVTEVWSVGYGAYRVRGTAIESC